ncbi:MAG: ribosome-associated translation inhibitor RaiA [Micrococcales bacterium]|nr:ribosome-associated translation inhibitor RaiA [Micrococcales bacterium]
MEIVIAGRHTEVSARFRDYAEGKLAKISRYDSQAHLAQVEVVHEANPRQAGTAMKVEITVRAKGPVTRAEAAAGDMFSAFDVAMGKLMQQVRRANDRRKSRHKTARRTIHDLEVLSAELGLDPITAKAAPAKAEQVTADGDVVRESKLADSPVVIREKIHQAVPMTVEDAIYEMELVGHPFFLFVDYDSGMPSVLYHRHGWTYGVLRLEAATASVG